MSVTNPYCWQELVANTRGLPDREGHVDSFTSQNMDARLCFAGLEEVARKGTYSRIPYSLRVCGRRPLVRTDRLLLRDKGSLPRD